MRKIKVRLSTVAQAIDRAKKEYPRDEWQAETLEILLIPNVYQRWKKLNQPRFPDPTITRVKRGECRFCPEPGFVFSYGMEGVTWNSIGSERWPYSHSPSVAWDGVRRETVCRFLENLRNLALHYTGHRCLLENYLWETEWDLLNRSKIEIINDLKEGYQPTLI